MEAANVYKEKCLEILKSSHVDDLEPLLLSSVIEIDSTVSVYDAFQVCSFCIECRSFSHVVDSFEEQHSVCPGVGCGDQQVHWLPGRERSCRFCCVRL